MTLKELILDINDGGWLISNLYQMDYNSWRANLRKAGRKEAVAEGYTSFSYGATAFKALLGAWNEACSIDEKNSKKVTRHKIKGHT